ncbi:MAG: serine/threonine protein kinase [Dokdonella sp.]|jgi:serine/threonine-protein kinase|uniref:serine/threonine protein kinase n=1 Tax=Dokdonella sp. TaxID=2291710 RepID=UPI0025BBF559|nr:serine/threonine-protein kinase [Dokdonella sp.]MBK8124062.1 serine/threonine protein kinase [Dokdonella sp.]
MDAADRSAWQHADRLFAELIELDAQARERRLETLSAPEAVRRHLLRMLASTHKQSWLDHENPGLSATARPENGPEPVSMRGRRLSHWEIGGELGRGGMAVVYRARRVDGAVDQEVALKVLTIASLSRHGAERFQGETRILARLRHPHIVGLLDTGITEDGTPWLAMPLVDGVHISRWCDEHALDTRATVQLFLQVAGAVASAHRSLVIHRDIKPSNVLVDAEGQVHLLDFGIARLLNETEHATVTQWRALTPGYAAPEQHTGESVTTAVDVHGLGALLYRLLTGQPPRGGESGDITLPSQVATRMAGAAAHHQAALRGDLDGVLMKALASDPAQRYGTAEELAADLNRWLDGRTVLASAPGKIYRARKFVRRHRIGVAAGAAIVLAIATGMAGTLWQARIARLEAARAVAVKDFLVEVLESTDPTNTQGRDPRASELLREGAKRIDHELSDRPLLRAELLLLIGRAQLAHARIEDAAHSLDSALILLRSGKVKDVGLHAELLADRAMVAYEQGALESAVDMVRQADALLAARDGSQNYTPQREKVRASLADLLVVALHETREGASIAADLAARMRATARTDVVEYGYALRVQGAAADLEGRHEEAIRLLQQAEQVMRAKPERLADLASVLNELGIAQSGAKHADEAERMFASALALHRQIYGDRNPTTLNTRANLAAEQMSNAKAKQAVNEYASILSMQREVLGTQAHPDMAVTLGFLAIAHYREGNLKAAQDAALQGWDMSRQLPEGDRTAVHWLAPLLGLIDLERETPRDGNLLAQGAFDCEARLINMSPLRRWVCVVRAWQMRTSTACPIAASDIPDTSALDAVDRRWWLVYRILRARCDDAEHSENAADAVAELASADAAMPSWLRSGLMADGLLPSD